ncbi:MAG TPA: hypothetical protein VFJ13_09985 [Paracoccaceae bacterium]|nr:hypothetical protein [Paracoccaceae bacterium]
MTRHGPALLALSVLAIAGWTYNVNYDTRAALDRISELRANIADERETLQVLRVEWAWLNAPDRLARLVVEHNDRLALTALTPDAFGYVAAVPYPPDLPAEPPSGPPPELLVATAPDAAQAEGALLAGVDEAAPDRAAVETGELLLAEASTGNAVDPGTVEATGTVVASAADKAGAIAGAPPEPTTMREAVTLALIEAGVVQPDAVRATVMPASVTPGTPVPPARPAVWARQ